MESGEVWVRRPGHWLLGIGLASTAALLFMVMALLSGTRTDLIAVDAEGGVQLFWAGGGALVAADAPVTFRGSEGQTAILAAHALRFQDEPRGPPAANRRVRATRNRLAAMLTRGPVKMTLASGSQPHVLRLIPRRVADVPGDAWIALVSAVLSLLCGMAVWLVRPRRWAAAALAVGSVGIFAGGVTIALSWFQGIETGGTLRDATLGVNLVSGHLLALSLIALFARFPAAIVPLSWLWALPLTLLATIVVTIVDPFPDTTLFHYGAVMAEVGAALALIAVQLYRARRDPAARLVMWRLGGGIALSSLVYTVLVIAPQALGGPPIAGPGATMPLLLAIYAGLALAVLETRLLDLGGWVVALVGSALAAVAVLLVDAGLVLLFADRQLALVCALVLVGFVSLVVRDRWLRRGERRRLIGSRQSLAIATRLAFDAQSASRPEAWLAAFRALFQPLETQPAREPATGAATVVAGGAELHVPGVDGMPPLVLRHAAGGTRLFGAEDAELAEQLLGLVAQLVVARDAHVRAILEERGRIARDLHDDVSSRLLTGLRRADADAMRGDIHAAMADIRGIVAHLAIDTRPLCDVLGDARHEMADRLEAEGVALDWPVLPASLDAVQLGEDGARQIASVLRELTSNVLRHAAATRVTVEVALGDGAMRLTVRDDGCGIATKRGGSNGGGHGRANMRDRIGRLGGSFALASDARGTIATISVPMATPPASEGLAGTTTADQGVPLILEEPSG